MEQKCICFFSGDITNSGGTERVASVIANELNKKKEYKISFLSLTEKKKEPFFQIDSDIKRDIVYDHVVRGMSHLMGIVGRVGKYIKKNDIDIIIDIDGILDMYTLPNKLFRRVKVISWEHYNYYQHPFVSHRKYTRRMSARWADAIVTLTEEDKGYYENNLKIRCPIRCIYNPVIWKNKLKEYDINSKMILSVGRLTYQKGFDILVDVANLFLKKYPDWKWVILGEGEDRDKLEQKILGCGLERQVILKGNVDNIDDYYSQAAMYVMTSRFEGLPMTLLETKPFHLPLVSFNCKTGPSELIDDGNNGFLIEDNDIKEMAEKIEVLINNEKLRNAFSEKSQTGMERFELDSVVDKWDSVLKRL